MKLTAFNAKKIGMQINANKTKLLCISVSRQADINTYIKFEEQVLYGEDNLVMLGFCFGRHPNADAHIRFLTRRFYSRMWVLRHTKAAGIAENKLVSIYCCYMRPLIEYASNAYGPQLQKNSLRIIYGIKKSYGRMLSLAGIQSLKTRRKINLKKFALKVEANDRFRHKWIEADRHNQGTRRQEKYEVQPAKFDRYKYGHVNAIKRILNNGLFFFLVFLIHYSSVIFSVTCVYTGVKYSLQKRRKTTRKSK